jgi:hypothetical protein
VVVQARANVLEQFVRPGLIRTVLQNPAYRPLQVFGLLLCANATIRQRDGLFIVTARFLKTANLFERYS